MDLKEALIIAKKMTAERLNENLEYDLYIEIDSQLKLMENNVYINKNEVTIGLIAIREFEETDSEYSDIISKVSYLYKHPEISSID